MKYISLLLLIIVGISCNHKETNLKSIIFSGEAPEGAQYLILGIDTLIIKNGNFIDTLPIDDSVYDYVKLSNWKWPKLIYLDDSKDIKVDFSQDFIKVPGDKMNDFLLNSDSILKPYSLSWNMEEEIFRNTIASELNANFKIIDSVMLGSGLDNKLINEIKSIELFKVAHRTANFISFQERKDNFIDRNIYDFIGDLDLNNHRLRNQVNNRNFQYYYLLDKVSDNVHDSIYPFAVIDTINKYSTIESIRKMIISSTVKSSFYSEDVDHDKLVSSYEDNFGALDEDDQLFILQAKIKNLQIGKKAPSIGELENLSGDLVSIEDLKGKNILLTVWGSWCPYCKEELPALKNLIDEYGNKFTSVGISFDKDKEKLKSFIKENNWQGIHLIDPERTSTFQSNYLINGTNVHLLIDKDGIIISDKTLKPSSKELEKLINSLE